MPLHVRRDAEPALADDARERAFAGVAAQMSRQVRRTWKQLPAEFAAEHAVRLLVVQLFPRPGSNRRLTSPAPIHVAGIRHETSTVGSTTIAE